MPDNVTVDNGDLADFEVSADEATSGLISRVKVTYSADGSDTHVPADGDGLLVNLGANNDVTVTGSVSLAAAVPSGTNAIGKLAPNSGVDIGDVDVTSLPAIPAGTNDIGQVGVTDGSGTATVTSTGGTHEGLAVALIDDSGDQLTFAKPASVTATPTIDTSAYASGDSLDSTIISFSNAVAAAAGSGWITKVEVVDKDNEAVDFEIWFFNQSGVSPATENTAFSLSDTDADKICGVIDTSNGAWFSYSNGSFNVTTVSPPLPFKLAAGTTLYAAVKVLGAPTYASASDLIFKLHILQD